MRVKRISRTIIAIEWKPMYIWAMNIPNCIAIKTFLNQYLKSTNKEMGICVDAYTININSKNTNHDILLNTTSGHECRIECTSDELISFYCDLTKSAMSNE